MALSRKTFRLALCGGGVVTLFLVGIVLLSSTAMQSQGVTTLHDRSVQRASTGADYVIAPNTMTLTGHATACSAAIAAMALYVP